MLKIFNPSRTRTHGLEGLSSGCFGGQTISKTCKAILVRNTEIITLSLGSIHKELFIVVKVSLWIMFLLTFFYWIDLCLDAILT